MKGNPMQRNFGIGASSPAQKSAYPAKGDPKRKNYSKNVIDASSAHATKYIDAPEYVKGFKQDSQRTMTQDRSKLSKDDLRMDKWEVEGFETDKGEQVMPKIMAPESIKSKPIPEKTLKSPVKHAGHGKGIGMKHHKGGAREFDIEEQVKAKGATGTRYQRRVYGEQGSKLRRKSEKLAKAKKKKSLKARVVDGHSGEKWSPGSLIRKNRVKNLQKRVDRIDDPPSKEYLAEQARQKRIAKAKESGNWVEGSF